MKHFTTSVNSFFYYSSPFPVILNCRSDCVSLGRRTIAKPSTGGKLYFSNSATAMPTSVVLAPPPMSGVRGPCSSTCSMAPKIASCAAV